MAAAEFFAEALPYACQAHAATGVFTSVLLAQAGDETGFGGYDWTVNHNPGNVSPNGEASYPTLEAGTKAWIQTYLNGYYTAVLQAKTWQAQCYALGESPWASGHYNADGGVPGTDLIKIVTEFNLTQYDAPTPKPTPVTPPAAVFAGGTMNALDPTTSGTWVVDPTDGHVEASQFGGAPYLGGLNEPNADRDNWKEVGTIVGITPFKDAAGWGYAIIIQHFTPIEPGGALFSWYTFSRSGANKVLAG